MAGAGRISRHRLAAFVAILIALLGVWWGVRDRQSPATPEPAPPITSGPETSRLQAIGQGLLSVRSGMPRAEVEALIGRPDPKETSPVERMDGQTVFRIRYMAVLRDPHPVAPNVRGYCEVELIYDASRSGHPLIQIIFTPKLPPPGVRVARAT